MSFVCNECHLTWPDKDNQVDTDDDVYDSNNGICPECHEEEEEESPQPFGTPTGRRGGSGHKEWRAFFDR